MKFLKIVTALALVSTSVFAFAASEKTDAITKKFLNYPFELMTVSHRAQAGLESRIFPENSLPAIDLAIHRGVNIIEVDPRLTKDGVYVILHDPTLNRTTNVMELFPDRANSNGLVPVKELTLEEVKQLKLTDGFDGGVHRVPTLKEVLALAKDRVFIDLDLKEIDVPQLQALTKEFGVDNLLAYNNNAKKLKEVTDATGVMPLPINVRANRGGDPIKSFHEFKEMWGDKFKIMHTFMSDLTPELVQLADKNHVRLWINTLDDPDAAAERFDYHLWADFLKSGANVFQSDLAIELTRFIKYRNYCLGMKNLPSCEVFLK